MEQLLNYKNYKNICNLLYHRDYFGLDAEWHFFATSHGKNACDGTGRLLKEKGKISLFVALRLNCSYKNKNRNNLY